MQGEIFCGLTRGRYDPPGKREFRTFQIMQSLDLLYMEGEED